MHTYTALLHQSHTAHFRVSFPDFPGLQGTAVSLELVRPLAEAILASHLEEQRATSAALPEPRSLQDALCNEPDAIALLIQVSPGRGAELRTHIEPEMPRAA